jgi:uncharacterized membrane protein
MTLLIIGIVVMIGIHLLPAFPDVRERLIGQLGQNGYRLLFSVVSTLGLVLLIYGFAKAPVIQIWSPPSWTRYVAMVLMVPVFILLIAAYLPGEIKAKVKHPFLVAIKTWALAHLIANGDLASMILFGSFSLTRCSIASRSSGVQRRARWRRPRPGQGATMQSP